MQKKYLTRKAHPDEFPAIGQLMVKAYAALPDFPSPKENPKYFNQLANIGELKKIPG